MKKNNILEFKKLNICILTILVQEICQTISQVMCWKKEF